MERFPEIIPIRDIEPIKENYNKNIETIFERFLFKEEKTLLKNLEIQRNFEIRPLDLEINRRHQRIDDFILERMRNPFPRVEPQAQRVEPQVQIPPSPGRDFVSPTGFTARAHNLDFPRTITVKGQRVVLQGNQHGYTEVHFTPGRRNFFDVVRMTDSLAKGIQGVVELLEAVDQGKFDPAELFVGVTNINMALIAQRLGFAIVDECRTPDGQINTELPAFTVVGKLEDIRERIEEFQKKGTAEKLSQRNQRLKGAVLQVARG